MGITLRWPFRRKRKQAPQKIISDSYISSAKVYTPVSELAVGMYVTELDRPWLESSFKFQGFELKTEEEVMAVRKVCDYVYIDMTKEKIISYKAPKKKDFRISNTIKQDSPPKRLSEFKDELPRSEKVYASTKVLVNEFMNKIAEGGSVDTKLAKLAVAECVNSVLHSPDAMLWLSQLKHKDEYTSQHSLNVCVLSIVLGRQLNLSEAELNVVGLCGLMHDMGKMLVPNEILNKPGQLNPEEFEIMRSHTKLGYELLKSSDDMHVHAVEAAFAHHEQLKGKGYPRRLSQGAIAIPTRIVTIADTYDAITSDRVYQKGRTHLEATHVMSNLAGTHMDSVLVYKFIESLGVYPPGCIVELTNGAIAIVIEINERLKLRPKIVIILDEDKNPVPEQVLDLSKMIVDKRGAVHTIKGIVRAMDWNIDTSKYYQAGVMQRGFAQMASDAISSSKIVE